MNRRAAAVLACACLCAVAGAGCSVYVHDRRPTRPVVVTPAPAPRTTVQVTGRKRTYRYYPDACVYYSCDRDVWFYLEGDRWQVSAGLPVRYRYNLEECVTMELETERPYDQQKTITLAHPGRARGHDKDKWDDDHPGKAKGHSKHASGENERGDRD